MLACAPPTPTPGAPAVTWVEPEVRGADTLVQVPVLALSDTTVSDGTASGWVNRQRGGPPEDSWLLVPLDATVEVVLEATVRLEDCTPTHESGDGSAFGWIGLTTSTDFAGIMIPEGFRIRAWSQDPYGPGTGARRVVEGQTMTLRLANEAGQVRLWRDGVFLGETPFPAHVDFADPPEDPIVTGLELAGIACTLVVETLTVMRPRSPSTHPARLACDTPLRNPDLAGVPVPERWGLETDQVADLEDAWQNGRLAAGARLLQALEGTAEDWSIEGTGEVVLTCGEASVTTELPASGSLPGCSGSLVIEAVTDSVLERVSLGEECSPWPDLETWTPPALSPDEPVVLDAWVPLQRLNDAEDGPLARVQVSDEGLSVSVDTPGQVQLHLDPGGAPYSAVFEDTLEVPWSALDLGPHSGDYWDLQLVHGEGEDTAALAPRLVDGPRSTRFLEAPAEAPRPTQLPSWQPAIRPTSHVLWTGSDDPAAWQELTDLGLSGVSIINPHPNEVASLASLAVTAGLDLELFNFELHRAWAEGDERERYLALADAITESFATHGQPRRWGLVDEPLYSSLLLCRDELAADPSLAVPVLADALEERGCTDTCDPTQAWLACLAAWPEIINDLVEELDPGIPVAINLTPDGAVLFDELPGELSLTNNWIGTHRQSQRREGPAQALAERDGTHVGYTVIVGATREHAWAGTPSATDWTGQAWTLLGQGATGLRHLAWPPGDSAILDALLLLEDQLRTLPLAGQRAELRVAPSPLSAWAWVQDEEELVVVTNPTNRTLEARVECPDGRVVTGQVAPFGAWLLSP